MFPQSEKMSLPHVREKDKKNVSKCQNLTLTCGKKEWKKPKKISHVWKKRVKKHPKKPQCQNCPQGHNCPQGGF